MNDQISMIEATLLPIEHVTWDRYTNSGDNWIIYGWIDREDAYKDFITVEFDFDADMSGFGYSYVTSSAKYSEYFHDMFEMTDEHVPCQRAENTFKNIETVKLNRG